MAVLTEQRRMEKLNPDPSAALAGQVREQYDAAQRQSAASIDRATEQAVNAAARAQEEAQPRFQAQADAVDRDEALSRDNQALYAAARGDRGGIGAAQYDSILNTAARNRQAVQTARNQLAVDTRRQIADLRARGEYEKADAALALSQQYLSRLTELEQWAAQYRLQTSKFNADLDQWEANYRLRLQEMEDSRDFRERQFAYTRQRAEEDDRQWAVTRQDRLNQIAAENAYKERAYLDSLNQQAWENQYRENTRQDTLNQRQWENNFREQSRLDDLARQAAEWEREAQRTQSQNSSDRSVTYILQQLLGAVMNGQVSMEEAEEIVASLDEAQTGQDLETQKKNADGEVSDSQGMRGREAAARVTATSHPNGSVVSQARSEESGNEDTSKTVVQQIREEWQGFAENTVDDIHETKGEIVDIWNAIVSSFRNVGREGSEAIGSFTNNIVDIVNTGIGAITATVLLGMEGLGSTALNIITKAGEGVHKAYESWTSFVGNVGFDYENHTANGIEGNRAELYALADNLIEEHRTTGISIPDELQNGQTAAHKWIDEMIDGGKTHEVEAVIKQAVEDYVSAKEAEAEALERRETAAVPQGAEELDKGENDDIIHAIQIEIEKVDPVQMISENLLNIMEENRVKFTRENVIFTVQDRTGQVVWLEMGDKNSGLYHIRYGKNEGSSFGHTDQFYDTFGVTNRQLPQFLYYVLKNGEVVADNIVIRNGRRCIDRTYDIGGKYVVVSGVGTNGFFVSAHPEPADKKH